MTDLRTVRAVEERAVSASGDDPSSLVVAYLSELLRLQSEGDFLVRAVEARPVGSPPTAVVASVRGETFDPSRHPVKTEVKAITFHRLEFDTARGRARVIVDI